MRGANRAHTPSDDARAPDTAAVQRLCAGDMRAFDELYQRWFDRVHHLVRSIVADRDAALDATQNAFVRAWKSIGRLDDPAAFGGWLLRIARNAALDEVATQQRLPVADEAVVTAMHDHEAALAAIDAPSAAAIHDEQRQLIESVCATLSERDRTALLLQAQYAMSPADIGRALDISRDAANQLVHRARQRFAVQFQLRLLWNGGHPVCATLAALVGSPSSFTQTTAAVAARHAPGCERCLGRQRTRYEPAVLLPLLAIPDYTADNVAIGGRLRSMDIPVTVARPWRVRRGHLVVVAALAIGVLLVTVAVVGSGSRSSRVGAPVTPAPTIAIEPATTQPPLVSDTAIPTSTVASTSTTSIAATSTTVAPSTTTAAVVTVAPTAPPPPAPTIDAAMTPAQTTLLTWREGSPQQPVLTWSVEGGDTVQVGGPGVDSAERSGDVGVCPGSIAADGETCVVPVGQYRYRISVRSADGTLLARTTVTLTVGAP